MQPPYPSPVPTWHNDTYDAINPSRPELSQGGKTVIITGAGSGVGRATAIAFAAAGCERLVLIGRTTSTLEETANLLPSSLTVERYAVSVTDEVSLREVAESVSGWDVLILGAARTISTSSIVEADLFEWWEQYEVSVRAIVVAVQAFMPNAKSGASVLGLSSSALVMSPASTPGYCAYNSAKMAQVKVLEYLATELMDVNVVSVHPGTIDTNMFKSSGADPKTLPMDTVELAAHFLVWLSRPETSYLNGRFVWANWDVDELDAKAEDIQNSQLLKIVYEGWEDWASRPVA